MKVKLYRERAYVDTPVYQTSGAAAMDIKALIKGGIDGLRITHNTVSNGDNELLIYPGGRALIPTGLYVAIPYGYELEIRPRSGLAIKMGVTVANSPGTIDSDYRGEIGVCLINHSEDIVAISNGERIAPMLLKRVEVIEWDEVTFLSDLPSSERGSGGFGSTGKK